MNYLIDARTFTVSLENADCVKVLFHLSSSLNAATEYVRFYRVTENDVEVEVARYTGTGTYPGLGDNPPLVISHNTFHVEVYVSGATDSWGYRFSVEPCTDEETTTTDNDSEDSNNTQFMESSVVILLIALLGASCCALVGFLAYCCDTRRSASVVEARVVK